MANATRSGDALAGQEGTVADDAPKVCVARSVTAGSFAMPVPKMWAFEGTIGAVERSYDPPYFAGELAMLMVLRERSESLGERLSIPFPMEPEQVLGYLPREGDPVTWVVSAPRNLAIWGQERRSDCTLWEPVVPGGQATRTIISVVKLPSSPRPHTSARQALEDSAQWTGLSHEVLGSLLGASRRSVYNWLRGRPMSSQFETRAIRLRTALRPLADRRAPGEIASWLHTGATPPAELLREERWEDVEALVREEFRMRVLEPMPAEPEEGEPETYDANTRRAVLAALRTPPPVEQRRRPGWSPREVTGTTLLADDEEL